MKIRKRKAVFKVEYEVYAMGDAEFLTACELIDIALRTQKEIVGASKLGMDYIVKVIPHRVRRMVR